MALTAPGQPSDNKSNDFRGVSVPNIIGYRFKDLDPGSNVYVQRDDKLVIQSFSFSSGEVLNINIRILQPGHPAGRTQPDESTTDNPLGDSPFGVIVPINVMSPAVAINTLFSKTIDLAEGYLMSVAVSATLATQRGQTFVRAYILRGSASLANVSYLLASDYVTTNTAVGWPYGDIRSPLDSMGQMLTFAPANPGAGLDFGLTLPANTRAQLLYCSALLTTSAAVANRVPSGAIFDNASLRNAGTFPANIAIPASTACRVSFAPGASGTAASALIANVNMPQPTIITSNSQGTTGFQSLTSGIQAGDQWSAIEAVFMTWYDI